MQKKFEEKRDAKTLEGRLKAREGKKQTERSLAILRDGSNSLRGMYFIHI